MSQADAPHGVTRWAPFAIASALLAVIVAVALSTGAYTIPLAEVLRAIAGGPPSDASTVLWNIRIPRVVAGLVTGAALAAAGAAYQGMFRNPLVSPDILGVSAGAGFGALLGIYLRLPAALVQALAFAGGLAAVSLVMMIGARVRRHDPVLVLVLAGVAMGTLLGAGMSLLKILADPYTQLPAMTYWLLGSFAGVTAPDAYGVLPLVLTGLVPMALLRWRLNVLTLPDEEAMALGINVRRTRTLIVTAATLVTAAVVSISGVVGWVGLVIPHASRLLVGPDFRRLLPMSLVLGGGFVVAMDTLARSVAATEIPLGILTAVVGAPFFLWLLARSRRAW